MYLLDTNTVIYYLKDMGGVKKHLLQTETTEIAISAITDFELFRDMRKIESVKEREYARTVVSDFIREVQCLSPFHLVWQGGSRNKSSKHLVYQKLFATHPIRQHCTLKDRFILQEKEARYVTGEVDNGVVMSLKQKK